MLKKLFKFLRGKEQSVQSVPVIFLRTRDQLTACDEQCRQRALAVLRLMGVTVVDSDLYILDHHDLNTKPFPDEVKQAAQAYRYATSGHAIIVQSGTTGACYEGRRLVDLLLDCYGFTTVTSIDFMTGSLTGTAYMYRKVGHNSKQFALVRSEQFKVNRRLILTGKVD